MDERNNQEVWSRDNIKRNGHINSQWFYYIESVRLLRCGLMQKILRVSWISFLLCFNHCDVSVNSEESGELMPLRVGNHWLYQAWYFSTPDTLKAELTRQVEVTIEGVKYQALAYQVYLPGQPRPPYEWLYWAGPKGLYSLGGIAETDTLLYKKLIFKYPARVGESWPVVGIYFGFDQRFHFLDTLTYTLVSKNEAIETPAGRFECHLYTYRKKPAEDVFEPWDYYHYFSPGLGKVAYITKGASDGRTIDREYLLGYSFNE
ncbi:MAG: hypothetical protein WD898_02035 [Candidatus Paceibacterota bacterium]